MSGLVRLHIALANFVSGLMALHIAIIKFVSALVNLNIALTKKHIAISGLMSVICFKPSALTNLHSARWREAVDLMNTPPTLRPVPKRNPWLKYFLWSIAFGIVAATAFAGTLWAIGAPVWEAHQAGALNERWFEKNMPQLLNSVWVTIGSVITILASLAFAVLGTMSLWNLLARLFSGAERPGYSNSDKVPNA